MNYYILGGIFLIIAICVNFLIDTIKLICERVTELILGVAFKPDNLSIRIMVFIISAILVYFASKITYTGFKFDFIYTIIVGLSSLILYHKGGWDWIKSAFSGIINVGLSAIKKRIGG